MSRKKSRKSIHYLSKVSLSKDAVPSASFTGEGENIKTSAGNFTTARAIHRCDVRASGIFFKKRTFMLDKLFSFSVTRYFVVQLVAFCFGLGQFFLGIFVAFTEYLNLISQEGDVLPENFCRSCVCDRAKCSCNSFVSRQEIHEETPQEKCNSDINLHGIEKQCGGYFNLDVPKVKLIQPRKFEQSHKLGSATLPNHTDLGGGLVRVSVDSLLHGEIDKYIATSNHEVGKD